MIPAVVFMNGKPMVIGNSHRETVFNNTSNSNTEIGQYLILFILISLMILMIFVIKFIFDTDKFFKEDAKVQREIDKLKLAHGEYMVQQMYKLLERDNK